MEHGHNLFYPYNYKELTPEEKALVAEVFEAPLDYVGIGPKDYKLLRPFCADAANIYNMPVRESDIFVLTYQRSGTTWTQELVWLIANNFDYETADAITLTQRYTFLEIFMYFSKQWQEQFLSNRPDKDAVQVVINKFNKPVTNKLLSLPSPRFIKSHLPMSLLPRTLLDTAKVVYVARDPRDVAVSSYYHSRLFNFMCCRKPFKDFWQLFRKDVFTLTPVFEHVKEAWNLRHHPNMLFLFYEELSKDLPATVKRVADFLGKEVSPEQMTRLCDHLSIENFKNNFSVNFEELRDFGMLDSEEKFVRKGKAGGWRDYFDEEMTAEADQWIADNLKDTDLRYPQM